MMRERSGKLRQRADYTQKFNMGKGRHGWLRLTPAYSVKMVEEIIGGYEESTSILDPFCGTGTTVLCAANRHHPATTIDINPFLVWLAGVKAANYSPAALANTKCAADDVIELTRSPGVKPTPYPPMHQIERWWNQTNLGFLCYLKAAILEVSGKDGQIADLLNIAFCRTLMSLSSASFNHQSLSFRNEYRTQPSLICDLESIFLDNVYYIVDTASQNPLGNGSVIQGDARYLDSAIHGFYDVVITSPPYANRMSYIRELRPYMYWLGYLADGRAAGELDWSAIGGTWGVATSRLAEWSPCKDWWVPDELYPVVSAISDANNTNGKLLANYVRKYFEDISHHLCNLRNILSTGVEVHYIIGNSSFYGVLVSTERFYAEMLQEYGFKEVAIRTVRKRNSKKELLEFAISAKWP